MIKLWLILLCIAVAPAAWTQSVFGASEAVAARQIDAVGDGLRVLGAGVHAHGIDDDELKRRMAAIPPLKAALANALAILRPRLSDSNARLAALGPAPTALQPPESAETAATRRALARVHEAVDSEVKAARLLTLESDQIAAALAEQLRQRFFARLWTESRSILDPGLWIQFAGALPGDLERLDHAAGDEVSQILDAARSPWSFPLWGAGALVGLFMLGPARLILNRLAFRRAGPPEAAAPLRRSLLALALVAIATLTPLAAGVTIRGVLIATGALTPTFIGLSSLLIRVWVLAALLEGLGRALLSPGRPRWRLAPVDDDIAGRLALFPGLIGGAVGLASLVSGLNAALGASLSSAVASDCLAVLGELAAVGGALAMTARTRAGHMVTEAERAEHRGAASRLPWALAALAAWLAVIASLGAVLTGYLALASFVMRETVWIAAVLAMLFLALRVADEIFPALLAPHSRLARLFETALGVSHGALEQIAVLLSGLVRVLLLLLVWAAIVAPFGASAEDILGRITSADVVIHLGQVAISPGAILGALALLMIGLGATRAVRGWLEVRYLPKTRLDVGLRTSVASAVTYFGGLIAVLATFAYLGLSLGQIALFASALSVGIGFGLQAIIGNFVSGLILLAERPIQVGDWIAIGDLEGDVRRINIRATEIEMMDRSKLIVPNSDLVSKTVRNVTHGGALGRVRIVLKVDGAADPAAVRDILMTRLDGHPEVVKAPAAAVYLSDIKDGALEFTALGYVASPRQAYRVKSELLFQVVPDLTSRRIALASTSPIVNVGLADPAIEPAPEAR